MLFLAHRFIVALYVILPVATIVAAGWHAARSRRGGGISAITLTFAAGFAIALALSLVYAVGMGGRLVPTQVFMAGYVATGLLLVLKAFDAVLRAALAWGVGLRPAPPPQHAAAVDHDEPPASPPSRPWFRAAFVGVARATILFAVGLPYVMASVLTYRAKVAPMDDPQAQLGYAFQRVSFDATDGTPIVGWWIPAHRPRRDAGPAPAWGRQTVVVCHGLAANKSNQLILARAFPREGFNVLIIDFRAHGESGGQLTTFGDRERHDVLGAVRFLKAQHAAEAEKIFGVGASLGGAALIAAAADDSEEGQAIDAIAVYGTYDSLDGLTRSIANSYFFPPLRQLLVHAGLPLASLQTGAPLRRFAPADLVPRLWPRPILIIHGRRDEIIDFKHGQALYDAAVQPKYHYWISEGTHNDIVNNETAAKFVAEFFKTAEPVPAI